MPTLDEHLRTPHIRERRECSAQRVEGVNREIVKESYSLYSSERTSRTNRSLCALSKPLSFHRFGLFQPYALTSPPSSSRTFKTPEPSQLSRSFRDAIFFARTTSARTRHPLRLGRHVRPHIHPDDLERVNVLRVAQALETRDSRSVHAQAFVPCGRSG